MQKDQHQRASGSCELHEGRKRQIRRMFQAVGLQGRRRLHRVADGTGANWAHLRPGDFRRLTQSGTSEALRRDAGGDR